MEEWKQLPNYENYEVCNLGKVRNKKTGRILKPSNNGGYQYVGLSSNGLTKTFRIHQLVGLCFIENPNNKKQLV